MTLLRHKMAAGDPSSGILAYLHTISSSKGQKISQNKDSVSDV